jgi:hypothetical protein
MSNIPTERYVQEAQEYVCKVCDAQFFYLQPAKLVCPKCGTDNPASLVAQPSIKGEDEEID